MHDEILQSSVAVGSFRVCDILGIMSSKFRNITYSTLQRTVAATLNQKTRLESYLSLLNFHAQPGNSFSTLNIYNTRRNKNVINFKKVNSLSGSFR